MGKCAKQTTIAIIVNDGNFYLGSNWCLNPQGECPRKDMESGEGYHLCKEVCHQLGHAEEMACKLAGYRAKGGTLYLIGHTYCCDNCKEIMKKAGIVKTVIVREER